MIDTANQDANEYELVLLYQLLHASPIVGAMLYEPALNEAVRGWLNDVYEAAQPSRQRWLRLLFMYYGISTEDPVSYRELAEHEGRSVTTVREQVARGLRYLWYQTRVETNTDPAYREELFHLALEANEWVTCDPSDNASFEFFLQRIREDGSVLQRALVPKTPTTAHPRAHVMNLPADTLFHPEWHPTTPERVIMKGGKLVSP